MSKGNKILARMLDRLFAAIVTGPSLNCRPHASRQRIDLTQLVKLKDLAPATGLAQLLSESRETRWTAKVPAPPARVLKQLREQFKDPKAPPPEPETPEQSAARKAWLDQHALLTKLRLLVDEARTYEDDTGVYVLNLGFPLLSLPPGFASPRGQGTRRILAPIAFIPVSLTVTSGAGGSVRLECKGDEIDRVVPNEALLAWLEQQTGKSRPDLFSDEEGTHPWGEIADLVRHVAGLLDIPTPEIFKKVEVKVEGTDKVEQQDQMPAAIDLAAAPKAEDDDGESKPRIVTSAVLGLFPVANQGLLRDTQALLIGDPTGPIESFIRANISLDQPAPTDLPEPIDPASRRAKIFAAERLIAPSDPCQARAVAFARTTKGLVIHGPPGTGKSQTIANIIGDHLARSERVLFVCDKRTALDVVFNRLEALGLGNLCALIHDPQRDQRTLYMSIRDQLESLGETRSRPQAEGEISRIDDELTRIHADLSETYRGLMSSDASGPSLHELLGQWLAIAGPGSGIEGAFDLGPASLEGGLLKDATTTSIAREEMVIREALRRAGEVSFPHNPWAKAAGVSLKELVSRPMDSFREALATASRAAANADTTRHLSIPPFLPSQPLEPQGAARERLAAAVERAFAAAGQTVRALWAARDPAAIASARRSLQDLSTSLTTLRAAPFDAELIAAVRQTPPTPAEVAQRLGVLEAYLPAARAWWGFIALGKKSAAAKSLTPLGLPVNAQGAQRARDFYASLRAAMTLRALLDQFEARPAASTLPDRDEVDRAVKAHTAVLEALALTHDDESLRLLAAQTAAALKSGQDDPTARTLLEGLHLSPARAAALGGLETALAATNMLRPKWLEVASASFRKGDEAAPVLERLTSTLPTLEDVLRVREALAALPAPFSEAANQLIAAGIDAATGMQALRKSVLAAEVSRRLAASPKLQALDARRINTLFERYRELEDQKRTAVRDGIVHRWLTRQQGRLMAATGSRLNSAGADVRRRLTTRGRHAMRLRQVLALGRGMEGGDPLLDLRPVWMASPETVAQIFPREPIFDVVVFDEASQCRLEEALPVLTRAKRVVIAGDPKQLPPTRFFETGVAQSEAEEFEGDQQLFEAQQSEVEDLLGAALGLDIQQCYLDVHYRSRNSDLISFSNDQFYGSRLQPIPGHPSNRARFAPLTLYRASGVYEKRTNEAEALQVCRIIRDLLKRADPPSIGVGCFNLAQRDLISEKLDDLAQEDPAFGASLAAARTRRGRGAYEGLFVKNLENVQGDERDHIIISTTYGPDKDGRFYRRFGPLAMPGGGRRLNVLVTRAREEVHLVTSIPREVYSALPPIPPGQAPGGAWLLFAYLQYAEQLAARYEIAHRLLQGDAAPIPADVKVPAPAEALTDSTEESDEGVDEAPEAAPAKSETPLPQLSPTHTIIEPTKAPSPFAIALGQRLSAAKGIGSIIHWGNDGFCIDAALRHPVHPEDVTLGVLCDMTRYPHADDPVEWDIFRTGILESQGWKLQRLWAPVFFRDPKGCADAVLAKAAEMLMKEAVKGAIRVRT
jgi:AAA domain/REase_MTES_1575/Protein of unknown function (DUF4011)